MIRKPSGIVLGSMGFCPVSAEEHHKSGSLMLQEALAAIFAGLGEPRSCTQVPENALTTHSVPCEQYPNSTIQVGGGGLVRDP